MAKAQDMYELNLIEFHSKKDERIVEIESMKIDFNEKIVKIREIRKIIAIESKNIESKRYKEYLESFAWDRRRKLVLKRANHTCEGCGASSIKLDIHHLTYDRKGNELLTDLVAYCRHCHELAHNRVFSKEDIKWWSYLNISNNERPEKILLSEVKEVMKNGTEEEQKTLKNKLLEEI